MCEQFSSSQNRDHEEVKTSENSLDQTRPEVDAVPADMRGGPTEEHLDEFGEQIIGQAERSGWVTSREQNTPRKASAVARDEAAKTDDRFGESQA